MSPNSFAFVALLSWPLVALWLYSTRPVELATIWTILGAYLLLPVGAAIQLEGFPPLNKVSIPNLAALLGCVLIARGLPRIWHRFGLAEILILMLLGGAFLTSVFNTQSAVVGARVLPGLSYYDGVSAAFTQFINIIPFILARQFLRSPADTANILRILVIVGLIYSLLILFEVRMSPQLHTWIYGYFPHSFLQQERDGGFRPVVFLGHGLIVALFTMTTAVAAAALWRTNTPVLRLPTGGITAYLGAVLVLCKSLASLVYGAALVPLVRLASPKLQVRVAVVLVSIALAYPTLRSMDLVPTTMMTDIAGGVSAERSRSLQSRFLNEEMLLRHASERIWFGWGRWGRNRVYDERSGEDLSTTDGRWIVTLGIYGFVGFAAEFGLLSFAVFCASSSLRFVDNFRDKIYLAALTLIVAISVVDLLPNGFLSPWTWLLAGGLLGRAEALRSARRLASRLPVDYVKPGLTGARLHSK